MLKSTERILHAKLGHTLRTNRCKSAIKRTTERVLGQRVQVREFSGKQKYYIYTPDSIIIVLVLVIIVVPRNCPPSKQECCCC